MPSRVISGLSWNGCQRTTAGRFPRASSSLRLPMRHHGQITSEITSIVSIVGPSSLRTLGMLPARAASGPADRIQIPRPVRVTQATPIGEPRAPGPARRGEARIGLG